MKHWQIIGIMVVAMVLRFYALSHVPPSPSLDEASIGYNAYSILHIGADEYGTKFPLLLRAYDDFRPALYVYLVIPFVWLFGLSSIAVRLPSVLLSLLTVYLTYRIGMFIGKKSGIGNLGEVAAALLAISPWHIYISRLGHEANLGQALIVVAVYLFLVGGTERKKYFLLASGVAFGLSVHGYQSEKIITPLLLLSGVGIFWQELWYQKKDAILAGILIVLISLPAVIATLSPHGMMRFAGTSAFAPETAQMVAAASKYTAAKEAGNRVAQIEHSRYVTAAKIFVQNYVSHFSPSWLFVGSNRESFKVPGVGLLYWWEMIGILLGCWGLVRCSMPRKLKAFLLIWIFISPIPAAITTQSPHAMRSYTFVPGLQLLEAVGWAYIVSFLSDAQRRIAAVIISMVVANTVLNFWNGYLHRFPREQSDSFQYALRDAISYARVHEGEYQSIEFANQGNLYQSYMFYLFYSRFDPAIYQTFGGTKSGGYAQDHHIGAFAFGYLPVLATEMKANTLYLYDAATVPDSFRALHVFANLDGKPAIVAGTKVL